MKPGVTRMIFYISPLRHELRAIALNSNSLFEMQNIILVLSFSISHSWFLSRMCFWRASLCYVRKHVTHVWAEKSTSCSKTTNYTFSPNKIQQTFI